MQKRNDVLYHKDMPRKTLALLVGLILVTIILFIIALQTGKNQSNKMPQGQTLATPTPDIMHTTLAMSPEMVQVASGGIGTDDVMMDTSDNQVTAVQLELMYDPTMLSNVKVTVGKDFPNPVVLIDKNDPTTGKYTYAYGVQPGQKTINGKAIAAKVTFTARGALGKQSQIIMQPTTLVTARGVAGSVLKKSTGATVVIVPISKVTSPQTSAISPTTAVKVVTPVTSKAPTK